MYLKQKTKDSRVSLLLFALMLLSFMSCTKDNEQVNVIDESNDGIVDQVFKFNHTIQLRDGEFYVDYAIKANSQEEIDYVLSLNPKIKVEQVSENQEFEINENLELDHQVNSNVTISESIVSSNIPKGYKLSFWYDKPDIKDQEHLLKSSYSTREFTNSGASGIYVQQNGYQLSCSFFSRGCCWYSIGWYNRGHRTIGPSHTYSHSFYISSYTSYPGARMTASTTLQAWNSTIKTFLY